MGVIKYLSRNNERIWTLLIYFFSNGGKCER